MYDIEHAPQSAEPDQRAKAATGRKPRFVIGRGRHGGWIVNDRLGLVGGIFVSEAAARHYAFEESGGGSEDMVVLTDNGVLDLDLRVTAA